VNGQPYSKATRKRIGFVLQDDVLYESLTVKVGVLIQLLTQHRAEALLESFLRKTDWHQAQVSGSYLSLAVH
jgi:ABC-type multidrug transport system ATPase subunit